MIQTLKLIYCKFTGYLIFSFFVLLYKYTRYLKQIDILTLILIIRKKPV